MIGTGGEPVFGGVSSHVQGAPVPIVSKVPKVLQRRLSVSTKDGIFAESRAEGFGPYDAPTVASCQLPLIPVIYLVIC